jgi:N-acetylmuramic acid 6-phosphate etherase
MAAFEKTTEQASNYRDLEKQSVETLLRNINREDKSVPVAVEKSLPQIERLVDQVAVKMKNGGRLFYIGSGTSGRLGILDASECPPTFGVSDKWVTALIAGGDSAIRKAEEKAEDDKSQAWKDLHQENITKDDIVIGIAASGTTPYVLGGIEDCTTKNIATGCITCNAGSPLSKKAQFPIECVVGPEFVTGSSRMKAGTAQKLILNMISTTVMIKLGRVKGNKMVDMQLTNEKLKERGIKMIVEATKTDSKTAERELLKTQNVREAIKNLNS